MCVDKKKRRKAKKERSKEVENKEIKQAENSKVKLVDDKYRDLFEEVGEDIEDYLVYKVGGDGACGSNCTALAYHMDEKLGPYAGRNINAYIVENFSYFESHISFPHTQRIGAQRVTFKNKSEYLKFFK